ncbi:MAG: hypothetical protein ACI808_001573 [Paraglaciecola sp.]|jgi:hypothetical protein
MGRIKTLNPKIVDLNRLRQYQGEDGRVSVIAMVNWQVIKEIETEGPGFFIRSHSKSPYAWVDVFFGPDKEKVHVIKKIPWWRLNAYR